MVVNVEVVIVSATSVRVSWDRLDIPEITGYIVYYSQTMNSEMDTNTEQSINAIISVIIDNLLTDVEYKFEVVAVAELDGNVTMGRRSENVTIYVPPVTSTPTPIQGALVGGVVAFIMAVVVVLVILVVLLFVRYFKDSNHEQIYV